MRAIVHRIDHEIDIAGCPRQASHNDRKAAHHDITGIAKIEFAAKRNEILSLGRFRNQFSRFRVKWSISHWSASSCELKR